MSTGIIQLIFPRLINIEIALLNHGPMGVDYETIIAPYLVVSSI